MGNCVQSSGSGGGGSSCAAVEAGRQQQLLQRRRRRSIAADSEEEVIIDRQVVAPSVMKVKMVLTKGELGWLVAQLKAGGRRLEDMLQEMARKREDRAAAVDGWRPSLASIVECPAETAPAAATSDDYY